MARTNKKAKSKRWIWLVASLAAGLFAAWAWLGPDSGGGARWAVSSGAEDARAKAPARSSLPSKDVEGVEVRSHIDRESRDALREILATSDDERSGD